MKKMISFLAAILLMVLSASALAEAATPTLKAGPGTGTTYYATVSLKGKKGYYAHVSAYLRGTYQFYTHSSTYSKTSLASSSSVNLGESASATARVKADHTDDIRLSYSVLSVSGSYDK